ncbi:unnamed protein product [Sphenostylis stenocarpa]|uniref:Uncharacterized protein n=1 Tax=Sphenostylis stenocarpa TaxID=92480 RepID=A0AA86SHB9_9FABA|nr:unnamed protein product [Sphenostylis stenocarpa]
MDVCPSIRWLLLSSFLAAAGAGKQIINLCNWGMSNELDLFGLYYLALGPVQSMCDKMVKRDVINGDELRKLRIEELKKESQTGRGRRLNLPDGPRSFCT